MKALAIAALTAGLLASIGANIAAASERPLALAQYDGTRAEVATRYGIDISVRRWPPNDSAFECMISVSPKTIGRMKSPILRLSDTASGGMYVLQATLAWESAGDGAKLPCLPGPTSWHQANYHYSILIGRSSTR